MKELNEIKGFWEPREGAVILALETVEGKRDSTWWPHVYLIYTLSSLLRCGLSPGSQRSRSEAELYVLTFYKGVPCGGNSGAGEKPAERRKEGRARNALLSWLP
ncbi:hypothetical protein Cadr_000005226 [Camelus dromedarius]|uniref:Uncharacterized protein n=1 Tax=Camelus dromedarius TaxID=9838 RepID=A0A5N4E446_CAMDR|nr:hypothetical protein Cadr_000005226 [Camelus dromedarius]